MNEHPGHANLLDWDRRHYWHAFTQMAEYEPLIIERAEGCRLIDIDDREYLDGTAACGATSTATTTRESTPRFASSSSGSAIAPALGMGCDTTVRLAKRLADLAPGNLGRVYFASDGSSAVEVALKMVFQYWRRRGTTAAEDEVHCLR